MKFLFSGGAYSEKFSPQSNLRTPHTDLGTLGASSSSDVIQNIKIDNSNKIEADDNNDRNSKHNNNDNNSNNDNDKDKDKSINKITINNVINQFTQLQVHNDLCASAKILELRRRPFPKGLYPAPIPLTDKDEEEEEEEERQNKIELQREKSKKKRKEGEREMKDKKDGKEKKDNNDGNEDEKKIILDSSYDEEGIDIEDDTDNKS